MRTLVSELPGKVGETVILCGWVHRIRDLGKVSFVVLRDRSGSAQLVFEAKPELTLESVVRVEGIAASNEKAPGGVEVRAGRIEVLSLAAPDLPFPVNQDPGKTSLESVLDNRMISVRSPPILSIFRVQSTVLRCFADALRAEGFTEIKTSKLIGTGTEGGTGLFSVDYFDTKVFLAQSPQFYKQAMVASGLERVFEVGCAYRVREARDSAALERVRVAGRGDGLDRQRAGPDGPGGAHPQVDLPGGGEGLRRGVCVVERHGAQ